MSTEETGTNRPVALATVVILVLATGVGVYWYQFVYLPEVNPPLEPPTVRSFDLTASQWDFSPKALVVNKGDTVILKIHSSLDLDTKFDRHGFIILGIDGTSNILPKDEVTEIQFIAETPGIFQFICTIFCGQGHTEMSGQITVRG